MAWKTRFGSYTIGGEASLDTAGTNQQLTADASFLDAVLIGSVRVHVDPDYTEEVEIRYTSDGGSTFHTIRKLVSKDIEYLDEFETVRDVYFRPVTATAGFKLYWSASTDDSDVLSSAP
jgi:hypothetical protein